MTELDRLARAARDALEAKDSILETLSDDEIEAAVKAVLTAMHDEPSEGALDAFAKAFGWQPCAAAGRANARCAVKAYLNHILSEGRAMSDAREIAEGLTAARAARLEAAIAKVVDEFSAWERRTRLPKGHKHFPVSMKASIRVGSLRALRYQAEPDWNEDSPHAR